MHTPVLILAFGISCVAGLALTAYLLRMLRKRHEPTWTSLGSPSLVRNNTISNNMAVLRFLWSKEFLELDDPQLTRLCFFVMFYQVAYLILFLIVLIVPRS